MAVHFSLVAFCMRRWARSRNQLSDSAQSQGWLQPVHARDRSKRHERRHGRRHGARSRRGHGSPHPVGAGDPGWPRSDGVNSGQKAEVRSQRSEIRSQGSEVRKNQSGTGGNLATSIRRTVGPPASAFRFNLLSPMTLRLASSFAQGHSLDQFHRFSEVFFKAGFSM